MPSLLTKSFVIMATLAIGITLGNVLSHVSPTIQTVLAATGLVGRGTPQVARQPTGLPAARQAPDGEHEGATE